MSSVPDESTDGTPPKQTVTWDWTSSRLSGKETFAYVAVPPSSVSVPQIPGFTILSKLGEGGMGTVWRAHQISTKRDVALKLMRTALLRSERDRVRFEREVEISARLQHPNIAQVYDSGEVAGNYYYSLQLIDGKPLDIYVRERQCSSADIVLLMFKVCTAVQHAHQRGVIHRDLKPGNVLVDAHGEPFVLDFGLAKNTLTDTLDGEAATLTQEGMIVGTPAYMAPEQAAGRINELDTRTDVYTLGVILFKLLTGELPHETTGTHLDYLRRIIEEDVRRPRRRKPDLPRELEAILLKALEKDPAQRYSSAGEFAADLHNYLSGEPVVAHAPSLWYFLRKRVRKHAMAAGFTAALLLLAVAGAVFYIVSIHQERDNTHKEYLRAEGNATQAKQNEKKAEDNAADAERRRLEAVAAGEAADKARERETRLSYWTTVRLADDLIKRGEFGEALRRLWDTPKTLRGWEWGYLVAHCPLPDRTIKAHTARILDLAVSPDRKQLFSCGAEGAVTAWDATTLTLLWRHKGGAPIRCLAIAPNGQTIVAAVGIDLIVLDASSGKVLRTLDQKQGSGYVQLQFFPNGDKLLTCQEFPDRKHKFEYGLINSATWEKLPAKVDADHANGCIDAGGRYFFAGGLNRATSLQWYDPHSFKFLQEKGLPEKAYSAVKGSFLDTRRHYLITNESFKTRFTTLSERTIKSRGEFKTGSNNPVISVAVNWDSNLVGLVSSTGELHLCDLQGELLCSGGHADAATKIVSLGQGRFATAGRQGKIKVWNVEHMQTLKPVERFSPHWTRFHGRALALSATGKLACQSSISRSFGLGDLTAPKPWTVVQTDFGNLFHFLGFTPRDEFVVCHTFNKERKASAPLSWICRYASDGRADPLLHAVACEGMVRAGQMDSNGERLILAFEPGGVEVRALETWKSFPRVVADTAQVVAIAPDGRQTAALVGNGAELVVWEVESGRVLGRIKCRIPRAVSASFHPSGDVVAISDRDGGVTLFSLTKAQAIAHLQEHTGEITGMTFSPDGARLFTTSTDHTLRVWDWQLGRDLLVLANGTYDYFDVTLTDAGHSLVATSHNPGMQFHHALPWGLDEEAPAFQVAVSTRHAADSGRRLLAKLAKQAATATELIERLQNLPDLDPAVRHAALKIAARGTRPERLILVNSLSPR